jgi:hypothetical protein
MNPKIVTLNSFDSRFCEFEAKSPCRKFLNPKILAATVKKNIAYTLPGAPLLAAFARSGDFHLMDHVPVSCAASIRHDFPGGHVFVFDLMRAA